MSCRMVKKKMWFNFKKWVKWKLYEEPKDNLILSIFKSYTWNTFQELQYEPIKAKLKSCINPEKHSVHWWL